MFFEMSTCGALNLVFPPRAHYLKSKNFSDWDSCSRIKIQAESKHDQHLETYEG